MGKETMLGRIVLAIDSVPVEMLGTLLDLINRLGGKQGQEIWRNLKHLLRGEFEVKLPELSKFVGTIRIPATTEKFVAKKKFRNDCREIKFGNFLGRFEEDFLTEIGKIEDPIGEQILCYGNLTKVSPDGSIVEVLGGEAKAETTLTELFSLLKVQANGECGALLADGNVNVFYVRNTRGVLSAVRVYWFDGGWDVFANSVKFQHGWPAGGRVFSRAA